MKIGVALSGCDVGGVAAYEALRVLEEQGFSIGMLSVCGFAAATAMQYACGCGEETFRRSAEKLLRDVTEADVDAAIAQFSEGFSISRLERQIPIVVSSVNVPDGRICEFGDRLAPSSSRLLTFPLTEVYDVLSAAVSPVDGLASYSYQGCQLCDFSVWYGVPVYPLKMAGFDRIVSIAFVPRSPATPYEVLVKQRIEASAHLADVHISVEMDGTRGDVESYIETVAEATSRQIEQICMNVLF